MNIVKTETSKIIIRPDHILEIHPREGWQGVETVENSREVALALQAICSKGDYAILSFPPDLYLKKEIVEAFLEVKIGQVAQATIIKTFGMRLLVKIALQFSDSSYPSKTFGDVETAEAWLLEQLELKRQKGV